MGSADFGIPALTKLMQAGYEIAGIVSTPAAPKGRGLQLADSPIVTFARASRLGPLLCPEKLKDPQFLQQLASLQADLFVVVAFRILPPEVFAMPPLGTVNIHGSLLPRYRGPAPIQRAIEAGETQSGVSIFQIDAGVDTGRIILQRSTPIGPQETTPQLYERLSALGAEALIEALDAYVEGTGKPLTQDETQACRAPKLRKEEAAIDWDLPAAVIFNKIRAFKPFPGTWTNLHGKRLGIEWAQPVLQDAGQPAGRICRVSAEWFEVACRESRLRILEVKPEGKKSMSSQAFMHGTKLQEGMTLA
jgi:methionyl-tRNA formyltransferase